MPEGYTHTYLALRAAQTVGWAVTSRPAFMAGANGPDMLYCYQAWKSGAKRKINLPELGNRLHAEHTGAFLQALGRHAETPAQKDYFMGFLCHYAADTVVHPYVVALTRGSGVYGGSTGHGYFESALDSWLHQRHTGSGAVPVTDISPAVTGDALDQVLAQLQAALADVYGLRIDRQDLADAFAHNYILRRLFRSWTPLRLRRWLCFAAERVIGGPGYITGHLTPATLQLRALPETWQDPATGETRTETIHQLLEMAEMNCTLLLREAIAAPADPDAFWALVGSKDYVLGQQTAQSL